MKQMRERPLQLQQEGGRVCVCLCVCVAVSVALPNESSGLMLFFAIPIGSARGAFLDGGELACSFFCIVVCVKYSVRGTPLVERASERLFFCCYSHFTPHNHHSFHPTQP